MSLTAGTTLVVTTTFRDTSENDALVDPLDVVVRVQAPDGTITTQRHSDSTGVTKLSIGVYRFSIPLTVGGSWSYEVEGSGTDGVVEVRRFRVRPRLTATPIVPIPVAAVVVGSADGGVDVVALPECSSEPTSDPVSGGVLWVKNGSLKYRGPNGTVTTIAGA